VALEFPVTTHGTDVHELADNELAAQVAMDLSLVVIGLYPRSTEYFDSDPDIAGTIGYLLNYEANEEQRMERVGHLFTDAERAGRRARAEEFIRRMGLNAEQRHGSAEAE
jgi:hypothetical protein